MSDALPAAAVEAGRYGILRLNAANPMWQWSDAARAVLVAASERIECPATTLVFYGERRYDKWEREHPKDCDACAGSGFLYVLKQEKT